MNSISIILIRIYNFFETHGLAFRVITISVFACMLYLAFKINLEEDITKALPQDYKIEKVNTIIQNTKFLDRLTVLISLKDTSQDALPDSLISFADKFVAKLDRQLPGYIKKINYKVDEEQILNLMKVITEHLPLYLDEKDYKSIDSLIDPKQIGKTLEQNYRTLTTSVGFGLKKIISKDPVGITFIALNKLSRMQYDENFDLYDNRIFTKDQKFLILIIDPVYGPSETEKNNLFLQGIDSILSELKVKEGGSVCAEYFGASAVYAGNSAQIRKDTIFTQGITIIFIIVFLGFYFRRKSAPLLIMIPVVFGAIFSLAIVYLIKGQISVIALGAGSIVMGIAIDYSLHVFNHYRHKNDIRVVIKDLAIPLTIGSLTTICGFFSLMFVKSELLHDLGLFTALSLVGASLCSLVILPHLIVSKKANKKSTISEHSFFSTASHYNLEQNKIILFTILLLTIGFAYTSQFVGFEADMMKVNYMSESLKKAEKNLNHVHSVSTQSVILISEGRTLNGVLENNEALASKMEKLKEEGLIKNYSSISSLLISDSLQRIKIERWNKFWTPEKKNNLHATLIEIGLPLKFNPSAFTEFKSLLNTDFRTMPEDVINVIRKSFLFDYISQKSENFTVVNLIQVPPNNKEIFHAIFDNYPNLTIIDKKFIAARFVEILKSDFTSIALITSVLVFIILLLTYGRIELALVAFIPMFISWVWILGIMGLFGIQFNIINIILSALIFGLGDDYSLFIMDGLIQEYKTGKKNLSSYKSSILLSSITTIAGLGVLIFAKHPALQSIAIISIIGIANVVLISFILIPFFFNLIINKRIINGKTPWTLFSFLKSTFAFCYFLIGCLLLTVIGIIFTKLFPFRRERGKWIFHYVLSLFTRSLVYIMINVKKTIINTENENLSNPAIIICNHQSFLDILSVVMLHPKIVLLTNDWVWNSPVFGAVVKMADYYPVTAGVEGSVDLLAERIKQGYSIVIFPEGTRSPDGNIKRFHKGAFLLAEKLNIDILPLLIHGTGNTMTKNDFLLKDGSITLKFLPRISPENLSFGTMYSERAKKIGTYFRNEYLLLSREIEGPLYFKNQLISNYIYKGPILEWYTKFKIWSEDYYRIFHEILPKTGKILDIGCGYGMMAYMLHYTSPHREILGIDYDEDKILMAKNIPNRKTKINFEYCNILNYEFEKYDGIIISDVLHYLRPQEQISILCKSIQSLLPGGTLVIRDGNNELKARHRKTQLTEFLSTKIFSFNKTEKYGLSFLSSSTIQEIAASYNVTITEIENSKVTSNVLFVIKSKAIS